MKINYLPLILGSLLFSIIACQKEVSNEIGGTPSAGFLELDASGNCLPKNVNGVYEEGTALVADNNYIDVHVNVTKTGTYTVYTDTVNGIYFRATGSFAATGDNTVRLKGNGTPAADGITNFTVNYQSTQCLVPVTILPVGGAVDAVFTLAGAPDVCQDFQLTGDYVVNTGMTGANTVAIKVNVTTAGTYDITTATSNGINFAGSGALAIGAQTIILTASGTPIAAGNSNFVVTVGASSCNFSVLVTDGTVPATDDYFPRTAGSNWSYEYDDTPDDTLYMRAKAGTVTLGGNQYTVFEATPDLTAVGFGDYGAYRRNGADYHTYIDLKDYILNIDNPAPVDYIFLKDNVPAGNNWQSSSVNATIAGQAFTLRVSSTVDQKDVSITVNGTAYPNTIVVSERYQFLAGAVWVDVTDQVGYTKSYYSRNVGLIKQDYYFEAGNMNPTTIEFKMELDRYEIIP